MVSFRITHTTYIAALTLLVVTVLQDEFGNESPVAEDI